jgi:hypothetical protein
MPGTLRSAERPKFRPTEETYPIMLLLLAIVLLIIAIAGGVIIHPIIFALAIVALVMFFSGYRGRGAAL